VPPYCCCFFYNCRRLRRSEDDGIGVGTDVPSQSMTRATTYVKYAFDVTTTKVCSRFLTLSTLTYDMDRS